MRVLALSNNLHFSEESDSVRDLCGAMEEATDQDAIVELPAASETPPRVAAAHQLLRRGD